MASAVASDKSAVKRRRSVPLPRVALVESKSKLNDVAYQLLEEAIVTLRLPPGTLVSEQRLSEMTGIGRTPLREAVQRLAREHLIVVMPQRGLQISTIDIGKQLRLLETRRELERLICKSAAKRATASERQSFERLSREFTAAATTNDDVTFMRSDRQFNELCLVVARNEYAESAMRSLHGLSRRFWYQHYKQAADLPEMARLHAEVSSAIARGDMAEAGAALDRLVDNVESFTKATVSLDRV